MQNVAPGLFIADIQQAGDQHRYDTHEISDVVKLTHEPPDGGYPQAVSVHDHPMVDGPQNDRDSLAQAVQTTVDRLTADRRVVVHCSAGASRSVAVAGAALALVHEVSFDAALDTIRETTQPHLHPRLRDNAVSVVDSLRHQ
ncbi:dual specificity protein phosphatase family protein [Halosegnis longus]|uniref:dual specificity protein phosphatase family protein n=1 Tax=Halosegnis longus TaxID=2216012 RepID=UPI00096A72A2|nr:dual specificity protein phosphatase family protein [Halosegnis longus]